eukprot:GHVL01008205.1.p1 GENE.GHVL01008205.1~~GHVL01008205.1.p1  ORF type:complete len:184 (-),score=23.25 GHVL01008205.1:95-646(-)
MAEFSDVGAHCCVDICRQKDFLPFFCQMCSKTYCLDHFKPDDHQCIGANTNKRVLMCPICQAILPINDHEDPNLTWQRHNESGVCSISQRPKPAKKCPVEGCRTKLTSLNTYICKNCNLSVCMSHRDVDDHQCKPKQKMVNGFFNLRPPPPPLSKPTKGRGGSKCGNAPKQAKKPSSKRCVIS